MFRLEHGFRYWYRHSFFLAKFVLEFCGFCCSPKETYTCIPPYHPFSEFKFAAPTAARFVRDVQQPQSLFIGARGDAPVDIESQKPSTRLFSHSTNMISSPGEFSRLSGFSTKMLIVHEVLGCFGVLGIWHWKHSAWNILIAESWGWGDV